MSTLRVAGDTGTGGGPQTNGFAPSDPSWTNVNGGVLTPTDDATDGWIGVLTAGNGNPADGGGVAPLDTPITLPTSVGEAPVTVTARVRLGLTNSWGTIGLSDATVDNALLVQLNSAAATARVVNWVGGVSEDEAYLAVPQDLGDWVTVAFTFRVIDLGGGIPQQEVEYTVNGSGGGIIDDGSATFPTATLTHFAALDLGISSGSEFDDLEVTTGQGAGDIDLVGNGTQHELLGTGLPLAISAPDGLIIDGLKMPGDPSGNMGGESMIITSTSPAELSWGHLGGSSTPSPSTGGDVNA